MKTFQVLAALPALSLCASLQSRQAYSNGLAADTIKGCDVQIFANEIQTCETIAKLYGITTAQFITYNPSVGLDCAKLKISQAYCLHVQVEPTTLVKPLPQKSKAAPGKNYGGIATCDMWQKVFPDDVANKKETCTGVAKIWGVPYEKFEKWNKGLEKDCANIEVGSYLCVRVPESLQ